MQIAFGHLVIMQWHSSVTHTIGLSLRSSPIGARVRNKWGAKRILSTRFEQTRFAAAHPRPVGLNKRQTEEDTMNSDVKYQEAGAWFRHLSTLRRTTIGFLFVATAASLGFVLDKVDSPNEMIRLIAYVNIILCVEKGSSLPLTLAQIY